MQYFGGKKVIAGHIASVIRRYRKPGQLYLEPFCGMCSVFVKVPGPKRASDTHPDLVLLLQHLAAGNLLDIQSCTEEEYQWWWTQPPCWQRAVVGFGCSFGGKWFGGYARSSGRNYLAGTLKVLRDLRPILRGVDVTLADYRTLRPNGCVVYCDPPYRDTTPIHGAGFNTTEFWVTMRRWAKTNTVLVSEFNAPSYAEVVWERPRRLDMHGKRQRNKDVKTEYLYLVRR